MNKTGANRSFAIGGVTRSAEYAPEQVHLAC